MCSTHVHDMCIVQHGVTFLSQFIRSLFNLFQTNLKSSRGNARHVHDDQELVNLTLFTLQQCSTDPSPHRQRPHSFQKARIQKASYFPRQDVWKSIIGIMAGWCVTGVDFKKLLLLAHFDLERSLPSYYLFKNKYVYYILNIHCISIYRLYSRNPVHAACT